MRESPRSQMNFRLPNHVIAALKKRAKKDRVSMTTVIEAALHQFLGLKSYLQTGGAK